MQDTLGQGVTPLTRTLPVAGCAQGEHFSHPVFGIFMGLLSGCCFRLPMLPRIRDGLIWASFVLCPDSSSLLLGSRVGLLDQVFPPRHQDQSRATGPLFRTRMALSVWHQVRSCCHV
jgi:hypothetical protein